MGKAVLTGLVEEDSKNAIVKAAKPILGERGSLTGLLERIGSDFDSEVKRLEKAHGALPELELRIELIPKK